MNKKQKYIPPDQVRLTLKIQQDLQANPNAKYLCVTQFTKLTLVNQLETSEGYCVGQTNQEKTPWMLAKFYFELPVSPLVFKQTDKPPFKGRIGFEVKDKLPVEIELLNVWPPELKKNAMQKMLSNNGTLFIKNNHLKVKKDNKVFKNYIFITEKNFKFEEELPKNLLMLEI